MIDSKIVIFRVMLITPDSESCSAKELHNPNGNSILMFLRVLHLQKTGIVLSICYSLFLLFQKKKNKKEQAQRRFKVAEKFSSQPSQTNPTPHVFLMSDSEQLDRLARDARLCKNII